MSALGPLLQTLRDLENAPKEIARDVADLLQSRMTRGEAVEVRGEDVALVPGARGGSPYLSDAWADDVRRQAEETLARVGGGR